MENIKHASLCSEWFRAFALDVSEIKCRPGVLSFWTGVTLELCNNSYHQSWCKLVYFRQVLPDMVFPLYPKSKVTEAWRHVGWVLFAWSFFHSALEDNDTVTVIQYICSMRNSCLGLKMAFTLDQWFSGFLMCNQSIHDCSPASGLNLFPSASYCIGNSLWWSAVETII